MKSSLWYSKANKTKDKSLNTGTSWATVPSNGGDIILQTGRDENITSCRSPRCCHQLVMKRHLIHAAELQHGSCIFQQCPAFCRFASQTSASLLVLVTQELIYMHTGSFIFMYSRDSDKALLQEEKKKKKKKASHTSRCRNSSKVHTATVHVMEVEKLKVQQQEEEWTWSLPSSELLPDEISKVNTLSC